MKNTIVILLVILMMLSVVGCGQKGGREADIITVQINGTAYTVDKENQTIHDGKDTYSYEKIVSGIRFAYPNGETFTWQESNGVGTGTSSLNFDSSKYADPFVLMDVMEEASSVMRRPGNENAGIGILLLLLGVVNAMLPDKIWLLNWGWRHKNAEPSDLALGLYRVGGILLILIGFLMIVF